MTTLTCSDLVASDNVFIITSYQKLSFCRFNGLVVSNGHLHDQILGIIKASGEIGNEHDK